MKLPSDTAAGPTDGLRTLSRAALLLRLLADGRARPLKLRELVELSGLHKATVYRLMAALVSENLVELQNGAYGLGLEAWRIGQAAAQRYDVGQLAQPCLETVAQRTGDVGQLCVLAGGRMHCIGRSEGEHPILPTGLRIGMTRPLGCGVHGVALLAALPDEQVQSVIENGAAERIDYPQLTPDYLRAKVAETRDQGFAITDGDIVTGMIAVAVVAFDPWHRPLASIGCVAITERLGPERRPEVVALLREQATQLERLYRTQQGGEDNNTGNRKNA